MTIRQAFNSLQVRSAALLLAAVSLPFLALLSATREWQQHEAAEAKVKTLHLARHAAAVHGRLVEESERLLQNLTDVLPASPTGDAGIGSLLASVPSTRRAFVNLGVISTDGRTVLAARRVAADLAGRRVIQRALETGRFTVGGYERDGSTGQSSATVAYPVLDGHGRIGYVLFAQIEASWLRELEGEAPIPAGTTFAILDAQGTTVAQEPASSGPAERSGQRSPSYGALLATVGDATAEAAFPDGVRRLFAVRPLRVDGDRVFVAVSIPKAAAVDNISGALTRLTYGFLLAMLLAAVVVAAGNRMSLVWPLRQLVETTRRLSDGDLGARTGLRRAPEELKQLARAFDRMAAALQQKEKDVALRNAELAFQERRFRALIENSTDGIVLVDREGAVLYASPSTTRTLGYAPDELVGRSAFEMVDPDEREVHAARLAQLLENPSLTVHSRFRLRHKDGSWRWFESVGMNLLDDPAVGALVVNYRDITSRLEAEAQLRQAHDDLERRVESRTAELAEANTALRAEITRRAGAEEMLRKLGRAIEQTSDSVLLTNRDGVIEYVNPAFERLSGYSSREAIGATPRLVKSGRHDLQFYERLWAALLSGQEFRAEFVNRRKDGREYRESAILTPLRDDQGNVTHFVSTGRDITKLKRTEEALRRLNDRFEQEATRIASALHDEAGQFLTAAHISLAEVADGLPPPAREGLAEVKRDLDEVEAQLRRLAHELRPRVLEDMGLAGALKALVDGVARRTGIPIAIDVSVPQRCGILAETALYRFAQEGLTNMTRHARATRCAVVLTEDGRNLQCSIRDDGVGFDPAAVIARRDKFGLGLLGIRDRLEVVDGVLEIISTPGAGTELRAIIPLEP